MTLDEDKEILRIGLLEVTKFGDAPIVLNLTVKECPIDTKINNQN
jgi:hypothetical protein